MGRCGGLYVLPFTQAGRLRAGLADGSVLSDLASSSPRMSRPMSRPMGRCGGLYVLPFTQAGRLRAGLAGGSVLSRDVDLSVVAASPAIGDALGLPGGALACFFVREFLLQPTGVNASPACVDRGLSVRPVPWPPEHAMDALAMTTHTKRFRRPVIIGGPAWVFATST